MSSFIKIVFACTIAIACSTGCKKDEPAIEDNQVDLITGVYIGWEYRNGTYMPAPDSNIIEITVKKTDASSFEIFYEGKSDPYPKKFDYNGYEYTFLSAGPYSPYYHTITFTPNEKKLVLDITYSDAQGNAGNTRFTGKK